MKTRLTNVGLFIYNYVDYSSDKCYDVDTYIWRLGGFAIIIPDSVEIISSYAFYDNNLTSVKIGNSVTEIGVKAFADNKLTALEIPDSVVKIENTAFQENELTSVNIPNSVTEIGYSAFNDNPLTEVIIPNSVTEIGEKVFGDDSHLITGAGSWSWHSWDGSFEGWINN